MPLLEPASATPPLSLNQGDLLCGLTLHVTSCTDGRDGEAIASKKAKHALVISRPCVLGHKPSMIVAAVERLPDATPASIDTLSKAKDFLTKLRDGDESPDVFYLGHFPDFPTEGRYAARFDSLHTLQIPHVPSAREAFIAKHRKYTLHADFCRDLHVRIFQAFAKLGFDDDQWYGTEDLKFLIQMGEAEIAGIQAEKAQADAKATADGSNLTKKTAPFDARIKTVEESLTPFRAELARRTQTALPTPSV